MGVLLLYFLFICAEESIGIATAQLVSSTSTLPLQVSVIDPTVSTIKCSAKEYILPTTLPSVLYSITPKVKPSKESFPKPQSVKYINSPMPSKIPDSDTKAPQIPNLETINCSLPYTRRDTNIEATSKPQVSKEVMPNGVPPHEYIPKSQTVTYGYPPLSSKLTDFDTIVPTIAPPETLMYPTIPKAGTDRTYILASPIPQISKQSAPDIVTKPSPRYIHQKEQELFSTGITSDRKATDLNQPYVVYLPAPNIKSNNKSEANTALDPRQLEIMKNQNNAKVLHNKKVQLANNGKMPEDIPYITQKSHEVSENIFVPSYFVNPPPNNTPEKLTNQLTIADRILDYTPGQRVLKTVSPGNENVKTLHLAPIVAKGTQNIPSDGQKIIEAINSLLHNYKLARNKDSHDNGRTVSNSVPHSDKIVNTEKTDQPHTSVVPPVETKVNSDYLAQISEPLLQPKKVKIQVDKTPASKQSFENSLQINKESNANNFYPSTKRSAFETAEKTFSTQSLPYENHLRANSEYELQKTLSDINENNGILAYPQQGTTSNVQMSRNVGANGSLQKQIEKIKQKYVTASKPNQALSNKYKDAYPSRGVLNNGMYPGGNIANNNTEISKDTKYMENVLPIHTSQSIYNSNIAQTFNDSDNEIDYKSKYVEKALGPTKHKFYAPRKQTLYDKSKSDINLERLPEIISEGEKSIAELEQGYTKDFNNIKSIPNNILNQFPRIEKEDGYYDANPMFQNEHSRNLQDIVLNISEKPIVENFTQQSTANTIEILNSNFPVVNERVSNVDQASNPIQNNFMYNQYLNAPPSSTSVPDIMYYEPIPNRVNLMQNGGDSINSVITPSNGKILENNKYYLLPNNSCNFVKNIETQNIDYNKYITQNTSERKSVKSPPQDAVINILPVPVAPTVIRKPDVNTVPIAGKITDNQPQVYTRVPSCIPEDPTVGNLHQNCNAIVETTSHSIQDFSSLYQSIFNTYVNFGNLNETSYTKGNSNNVPITAPLRPYSTLKPVVDNHSPSIQYAYSTNDKYNSLVSSSLNNIASVIVTNLLSVLNTNKQKNVSSLSQSKTLPIDPEILPSVLPEIPTPSLDIPFFEVKPPCVESPRYLPDLSLSEPTNDTSKVIEGSSKRKCNKTQRKTPSQTKPSYSTITINVLPAVQQTLNDIIIIV